MKKLLLLLSISATFSIKAQITLDFSLSKNFINKVSFTNYGDKFWVENPAYDSVIIYNTDGTIFRQFSVPQNSCDGGINEYNINYLSDNLFNTDSLIEFLFEPCGGEAQISVINEQGIVLWTSPDTTVYVGNPGYGYGNTIPQIFKIENSFYLTYSAFIGPLDGDILTKVFSLPGSVPCNQCDVATGIVGLTGGNEGAKLLAYPNPFNHSLTISYELQSQQQARLILTSITGSQLKNVELKNQSGKLTFDTNDLPQGVIVATLYDQNQNVISKKLVKIE